MNKWKKRILIVFIAILLNVTGRNIAYYFEWPMYFNLCGTILAAYLEGPIAGSITAILSCAFSLTFSHTDWIYILADFFVAISAGLLVKKNRFFEKSYLLYSSAAFFTVIRSLLLLLVYLSAQEGKSSFYFVDATFEYLESISLPMWLGYGLVPLFVSFSDVLSAMIIDFLGIKICKGFGKKKKASELKKELMKKVSLGIVLTLVITSISSFAGVKADNPISFIEKLYNSDNGLVGGCLNDVAMTRDGSMWIATYGGLFRFNGSKFVLIDNLSSVRSVQTLFVDEDDRLWAGTQDSGVTLLNIDMSWVTLDMSTGLPSNSVKCISRDSNGLYYFGTTLGVVLAEYNNGDVNILKVDTKAGNVRDLSPDSQGHMFVMNNLGDVSCYENGELKTKIDLGDASAKGIKHNAADVLYIGTDSEKIMVYTYDSNGFHFKKALFAEGMKTIRDFYFDESGIIFIAADNAIGYLDNTGHLTIIETGEFNNSIDHIFRDYQGNLWFTSSRCGLLCLGKSCFTDIFRLCNEKNIVCNGIKKWNGKFYVGTNDGLKILDLKTGESIKNELTEELDGIRIRCLDFTKDGNLILATYGKGLIEITPDGNASEYISSDVTEKVLRIVKVLSDGTVISSSDVGLVFMKDHKVVGRLILGEDMSGGSILNILETEDHTLLCGTDGDGVAVIKDGKFERYLNRESDGIPSGVILRVVKDKYSDGYFILTGSGLCYMDKNFNVSEIGMPYYNNFDIAYNSEGEIFILGGAGIYICDYDTLMKNHRMENYALLDSKAGLPGSITSNAWNYISDDEKIYLCGTSGIYMLDLNNYEMNVEDFKTKITAVTLDGVYNDVTEVGTIYIPKDTGRIELSLEINNYTTADPFVSYYLSGVDSEKITVPASKLSSVTYYDIPYGNHDFVISVTDEKGRELSKQTYYFSKEREVFETIGFVLYFFLMLFTFIVFIVISIVQGALWSQRKKETDKHELVITQLEHEKTEALERALHMEESANRAKSEFLANISHEIKTPINAIMGMDTMIIRESSEENIRGYALDIDAAGKKLISLINNIHEVSTLEKIEDQYIEEILEDTEEKEGKAPVADEKERYHAPDATLLIVDNVETNITVARNLLKRIQIQVEDVSNGEEAVRLASEKQYDIILLDSKMPGMEGEDTMQNIRTKCPLNAETPIIVVTSHAVEGAREEYLNLGYTNYLSKPLDGIKLEAMIQSYLPDEKIIYADNTQDETGILAAEKKELSLISEIKEINTEKGIEISGGEDAYLVICRNFHDSAKSEISKIKEALKKKDFDSYTGLIHDLNNSSRLIGAIELSQMALELENAGMEGNLDKIRKDSDKLLDAYKQLYEKLNRLYT